MPKKEAKKESVKTPVSEKITYPGYIYNMSMAPKIGENAHWFQLIPIAFFTAAIIMITRMTTYERPMQQFFWSGKSDVLSDFFSYFKMTAIIACSIFVLILLLYRGFSQSFSLRKSYAYLPMVVYSLFVLLSYILSDYKEFALLGWNDRFEGTITLLCYMVMLFYVINTIRTEHDVKWVVYPLAITSALLGLLGISQALNHDFFRTVLGKKLITPSYFWGQLDSLNFTFQNKEIYQTVYNINYVSFYLTLLIPLFGMLFIKSVMKGKEETLWKKVLWGVLFTLLVFNLIGSASSGGLMGMAIVVLIGLIVLNKRLIKWGKPVLILILLTVIVAGISYNRWAPELTNAIKGVLGTAPAQDQPAEKSNSSGDIASVAKHKVDYMVTTKDSIILSYDGSELKFVASFEKPNTLQIIDSKEKGLALIPSNVPGIYAIDDSRYNRITVRSAQDDSSNNYLIIGTDGHEWPFRLTNKGPKFLTGTQKLTDLVKVPSIGWENNPGFGSGRGYIWSRTIPMMKDTLVVGHGADTYCIYFPQNDYVGKYNSGTFTTVLGIIVDKPHNMYFDAIIGTGGVSMLALLVLWGIYLVQSFLIYKKEIFESFISYVGVGIFLGVSGFLVSGLVNDSSVSVMPMFYGLLGTGISINRILKAQQ
jgi:hypothetical protein